MPLSDLARTPILFFVGATQSASYACRAVPVRMVTGVMSHVIGRRIVCRRIALPAGRHRGFQLSGLVGAFLITFV